MDIIGWDIMFVCFSGLKLLVSYICKELFGYGYFILKKF